MSNEIIDISLYENDTVKTSLESTTKVINDISDSFVKIYSLLPTFDYLTLIKETFEPHIKAISELFSKIKIPEIRIPPELLRASERLRILNKLKEYGWPIFLYIFDEDLEYQLLMIDKSDNSIDYENELKKIAFAYFDDDRIKTINDYWNGNKLINNNKKEILSTAINLYFSNNYIGAVSILMCQLSGLISDWFNLQTSNGHNPTIGDIEELLKQYNVDTTKNKSTEPIKKLDRNKLLYALTLTDSGYFYWNACVAYILNVVLSSDEKYNSGNQPNRNKICHGIQTDFGTKEHTLKSILVIDMLLELFEALEKINPCEKE